MLVYRIPWFSLSFIKEKETRFRSPDNDVRSRKKSSVKYRSNNNWRCMRWLLNRAIWLNSDRKWVNYILYRDPRRRQSQSYGREWCDVCTEYWMRWWAEDYNVIKNEPDSFTRRPFRRDVRASEKKRNGKRNVNYIGVSHFSRTMHCPLLHAPCQPSGWDGQLDWERK